MRISDVISDKNFNLSYDELLNLLKEAYRNGYATELEELFLKLLLIHNVSNRKEQLIDFFKWLNNYEELKYTEKGIKFYVNEHLKSINCC